MKKHLLLLPILAGLTLTGCEVTLFGKKISFGGNGKEVDLIEGLPDNFFQSFKGYKMASKVKDGGRYLLGAYRINEDTLRFANGDYHRDSAGYYPFYMGTVGGTIEGAAEIEVKMTGADTFTMQVFARGQVWNEKYIGVYAASSSYGNNVMSIALLSSPDQTTYTDPKSGTSYTGVSSTFKFYESYNDMPAYAPAAPFKYEGMDEEAVPKFLGTGHVSQQDLDAGKADYTSFDCKSYEVALINDQYDLAHLYEKI